MPRENNGATAKLGIFHEWYNQGKASGPAFYIPYTFSGNKFSQGNPRDKNGKYRPGGPFFMQKTEIRRTPSDSVSVMRPGWDLAYVGSFFRDSPYWATWDYYDPGSQAHRLQRRGAEAWNLTRPAKPSFSAAQALIELGKDVNPLKRLTKSLRDQVWEFAAKRPGKSMLSHTAEWYLAIQFGWLPLLSDIRKFIQAQHSLDRDLAEVIKREGKPQRRRKQMRDDYPDNGAVRVAGYSVPHGWGADMSPTLVTQCYGPGAHVSGTNQTENKTWACGSFIYLLPPGPRNDGWKKGIVNRLMVGRPTPSLVYNLIPWSWLVDYFTSVGDFMEAISPGVEDKLIAQYCYVMNQSVDINRTSATATLYTDREGHRHKSVTCSTTFKRTMKSRGHATPFGFGLRDTDLSLHQMGILGALGLSRLP